MPTGYTQALHDGEPTTFEQFVLRCSRAMGAAILQRDESPDVEIRERTLDDYYIANVDKSAVRLQEAIGRSLSEWAELQEEALAEAQAYRERYLSDKAAISARYQAMLTDVRAWEPPTPKHEGLKEFMIEQLETSIQFDCGSYEPDVPERVSADLYSQNEIARLTKDHARDIQSLAEERERVAGQNAWVRALKDSLTTRP